MEQLVAARQLDRTAVSLDALAVGGERGVRDLLDHVSRDYRHVLALMGVRRATDISRDAVG